MRLIRSLFNLAMLCLIAGVAGGLTLGFVLSRRGGWLTPLPWAIYASLLTALVVAVSWLDEQRSARIAELAWPLPAGFTAPEPSEQAQGPVEPALTPEARRNPDADDGRGTELLQAAVKPGASTGSEGCGHSSVSAVPTEHGGSGGGGDMR